MPRVRVQAGRRYVYDPGLWDQIDPPLGAKTGELRAGDVVEVTQLPFAPQPGTNGMAHIKGVGPSGAFLGCVSTNSLLPINSPGTRERAATLRMAKKAHRKRAPASVCDRCGRPGGLGNRLEPGPYTGRLHHSRGCSAVAGPDAITLRPLEALAEADEALRAELDKLLPGGVNIERRAVILREMERVADEIRLHIPHPFGPAESARGLRAYDAAKARWEADHPGQSFDHLSAARQEIIIREHARHA